jgi:hypothetical protein
MFIHQEATLEHLYRSGGLIAEQLMRLLETGEGTPSGRGSGTSEKTGCSYETARRTLAGLEKSGLVRSVKVIPPWRPTGRATLAYGLTRKGVDAGAFVAGVEGAEVKSLRAQYNRAYSAGKEKHALLRSEWITRLIQESRIDTLRIEESGSAESRVEEPRIEEDLSDLKVEEYWAEHGAVLWYGQTQWRSLEPDGLVDLSVFRPTTTEHGLTEAGVADPTPTEGSGEQGRSRREKLRVLLESDTGTQGHKAMIRKVANYVDYMNYSTDYGRDKKALGKVPRVLFISPYQGRSLRVREYAWAALEEAEATRESFARAGVSLEDLFAVTCLGWIEKSGVLGESCASVGQWDYRSILEDDHRLHGTNGGADPDTVKASSTDSRSG